ncbi:MAG: energy transducer TonB [Deltaproteobacteria bacterium]|nr:energy transducer TonB [Deltaproteobacteria bacterium]
MTRGFFFAMARWGRSYDLPIAGSLVLSLALHGVLAALVLSASWHKSPATPTILEVSLVAAASQGGSGGTAKSAVQSRTQTPTPRADKGTPKTQALVPAARKPRRRATRKRRPPAPLTRVKKAALPRPRQTPSSAAAYASLPASFHHRGTEGVASSDGGRSRGISGRGSGGGGQGLGAGPGSGGLTAARSRYLSLVRARILAHRRYPALARARRMEGVVRLRFTLSRTGSLNRGIRIIKPSGFSLLDEQAARCVRAAAPFPPFPPQLRQDHLTVEVPIVYRLKDWSG